MSQWWMTICYMRNKTQYSQPSFFRTEDLDEGWIELGITGMSQATLTACNFRVCNLCVRVI